MATASVKKENIEIEELKFNLKLKHFSKSSSFHSELFSVRGQQWMMEIKKMKNDDEQPNGLAPTDDNVQWAFLFVSFISQSNDKSNNWTFIANARVKLMSSKNDSYRKELHPMIFDSKNLKFGEMFISVIQLYDSENDYCVNDECLLSVSFKVGPLLDTQKEDYIRLEPIKSCCDKNHKGKYRVTIENMKKSFAFCTPEFFLYNIPWRLCIFFTEDTKNDDDSNQSALNVFLYNRCKNVAGAIKWSCQANIEGKLSADSNSETVSFKIENREMAYFSELHKLTSFPSKELKSIFENGSIVLELSLKLHNPIDLPLKEIKNDCNGLLLTCPICLENLLGRLISSTSCGHVFCDGCIRSVLKPYAPPKNTTNPKIMFSLPALSTSNSFLSNAPSINTTNPNMFSIPALSTSNSSASFCPICKQVAYLDDLRKIYLVNLRPHSQKIFRFLINLFFCRNKLIPSIHIPKDMTNRNDTETTK